MNKNWIIRKNKVKLILFFNGWGMDSSAIAHLETEDYDIIEFNDYVVLDFDEKEYQSYSEIYVIAWSLGVLVASLVLVNSTLLIKKSVAINGTANPVDAKEGIHPTIFKGTLTGWNEKNRERFFKRVIGSKKAFDSNCSKFGDRLIENQKEELAKLYDYSKQDVANEFHFNTAIVGNKDAIFSRENQFNYWQNKSTIKELDIAHYPFLNFTNWDNIITK